MGRVTIAGAYKEQPILKSFSEATWAEIIYACKKNLIPDNWNVGDQNTMLIGEDTYIIDIIGKNHDEYSDRSGIAPLTFQLHDMYGIVYDLRSSATNSGGWDSTNAYSAHLPIILGRMPAEVQNAIKEVRKVTGIGGNHDNLEASANKLFLLSDEEVFGKIYSGAGNATGEGTQYAYYLNGGSKIKYISSGNPKDWWLRSPYSDTYFCAVSSSGVFSTARATNEKGLSFAFCF